MALLDPTSILPATMAGTSFVPVSIPPYIESQSLESNGSDIIFGGTNHSCQVNHHEMDFSEFEYTYRKETWIPITWREILKMVAYVLVFLVSLLGNLLVILVVYYNAHMRTSINQYLVNLAAADLLVTLVCMWVHIVRHLSHPNYILPAVVCKLDGFVQTTALLASVLTLTVISVGRVVAVMFPLHARTSPDRAHRVIAAVWIASALLACPSLFYRELYSIKWANFTSWQCDEFWPAERHFDPGQGMCVTTYDAQKVFYMALTIALYFLPVAIMFINYGLVVWRLWVSQLPGEHSAPARHTATRAKKKVVKMVSVVLIVFVICWTPLQTIILYDCAHGNNASLPEWFSTMEFSAYFIAYSNSALNPIIYCGFNANFRQGLVSLLTCKHSSSGRIYHHRWTTRWTVGNDKHDLPGGNWKGITVGTRETTMGLSGPEPAVLLEFNSFRNNRYPQRCSVTTQSGRMLMSASATDLRNSAINNLHQDFSTKKLQRGVCQSESQFASPITATTIFPDDSHHPCDPAIESTLATGVFDSRSRPRQNGSRHSTFASTSSFSSDGGTSCGCCRKKKIHRNMDLVPQDEMYDLNEVKEALSNGTSEEVL